MFHPCLKTTTPAQNTQSGTSGVAYPGQIVEKISTGLPLKRDREVKRTTKFLDIVNNIECKMIDIQNFMNDEKKCIQKK